MSVKGKVYQLSHKGLPEALVTDALRLRYARGVRFIIIPDAPPTGLPVLPPLPSCMHASASTPAEIARCTCRSLPGLSAAFPLSPEGRLPHCMFRGLLGIHYAFRPACSLNRLSDPLPKCFSSCCYLHKPLWLLPIGTTDIEWDSHPQGRSAFPRRTMTPC